MSITIDFDALFETSESFDFNITTLQIIELANRRVGGLADGQQLTSEQVSTGKILLNAMVKNWRGDDIEIWNKGWDTLVFTPSSVVLGDDGFDYECIRLHDSAAINRPVSGGEHTSYWKKLGTSTAVAWTPDVKYFSVGNQTLDSNIISIDIARIREDESTRELRTISQAEYFNLSSSSRIGKPNQYWFRRQITPEIYFFPFPDSATQYVVEVSTVTYPEDFDNLGDFGDFLQEWLKPLIDGLAVELAPQYGIFGNAYNVLKAEANESRNRAMMIDHEFGSTFMVPDMRSSQDG